MMQPRWLAYGRAEDAIPQMNGKALYQLATAPQVTQKVTAHQQRSANRGLRGGHFVADECGRFSNSPLRPWPCVQFSHLKPCQDVLSIWIQAAQGIERPPHALLPDAGPLALPLLPLQPSRAAVAPRCS